MKNTKRALLVLVITLIFGLSVNTVLAKSSGVAVSVTDAGMDEGNKKFDISLSFQNGEASETIDYAKTEIVLPQGTKLAKDVMLDPKKKLDRLLRVDSLSKANEQGSVTIELGALQPGAGPTTNQNLRLATIEVTGDINASDIKTMKTQVVNNKSMEIPVAENGMAMPKASTPNFFASVLQFVKNVFGIK